MTTGKPVVALLRETFECQRYHTRISRASCANLARRALNTKPGAGGDAVSQTLSASDKCRGCAIGDSHRKGIAHPDAPAVPAPEPNVDMSKPLVRRKHCANCGGPMPVRRVHLGNRKTCSHACASEFLREGNHGVNVPDVESVDSYIAAPTDQGSRPPWR